jgi:hypothetical protein
LAGTTRGRVPRSIPARSSPSQGPAPRRAAPRSRRPAARAPPRPPGCACARAGLRFLWLPDFFRPFVPSFPRTLNFCRIPALPGRLKPKGSVSREFPAHPQMLSPEPGEPVLCLQDRRAVPRRISPPSDRPHPGTGACARALAGVGARGVGSMDLPAQPVDPPSPASPSRDPRGSPPAPARSALAQDG